MKELTKENFDQEVLERQGKVLVDFNADWCGPCQVQAPILEELADDYQIASVNVDDQPELANKYQVSSIPCLIVFKDGGEIDRRIGLTPKRTLEKLLKD